ncbi:hypothetical protein QQ045_015326 [Rhodiola kirilowii]
MEEGGMFEGLNDMFPLDDSCSFSLWGGGGSGGGGMNELGVTEVEGEANREEAKKKEERSVELGKAVMVGDGNGDGERSIKKGNDEEQVREIHTQTEKDRRKKMRTMFSTLHGLVPHLSSKADKSTIVEGAVNYVRVLQQRLLILKSKKGEMLDAAELKNKEGISFNDDPFAFPSSSFIKPQNQQQQEMLASREALLADYQYNNFSSSASVTPQNSRPTTPKTNLQLNNNSTPSPFGSPIMMINNNKKQKKNPRETAVKISLSPSSIAFKTFTSTNVVVSVCGREAQFSICGARKPGFYTGICSVLDMFQLEVKSFHISSDEQYSNLAMAMVQVTYLLNRYPVEEIYRAAGAELLQWVSSF